MRRSECKSNVSLPVALTFLAIAVHFDQVCQSYAYQVSEHVCLANDDPRAAERINSLLVNPAQRLSCYYYSYRNASSFSDDGSSGLAGSGGLLLGAMVPLHTSAQLSNPATCTGIHATFSLELIEGLKLAMEEALSDHPIARRLIRGLEVRDSCGMAEAAAQQAWLLSSRSKSTWQQCYNTTNGKSCEASRAERLVAVIGPALSMEVEAVSPIFNSYSTLHTSYWSTSDNYQDNVPYPYLFRTAPSDKFQATVILNILQHFQWTYIYLLHDTNPSARTSLADSLRRLAGQNPANFTLCFAQDESIDYRDTEKMADILKVWFDASMLESELRAPSVIAMLAGARHVQAFFNTMEEMAIRNSIFATWLANEHFVWIASDAWIAEAASIVHRKARNVSLGSHTVIGTVFQVPDVNHLARKFEERLVSRLSKLRLTPEIALGNPWLALAWQDRFHCRLSNVSCSGPACSLAKPCNTSVSLASAFDLKVGNLSVPISSGTLWLAVKATVQLVEKAFRSLANGSSISNLTKQISDGYLRHILRNETWKCLSGSSTQSEECPVFLPSQDVYQQFLIQGLFQVGKDEWILKNYGLWPDSGADSFSKGKTPLTKVFLNTAIQWANGNASHPPTSVCNEECAIGSVKRPVPAGMMSLQRSPKCCWLCIKCNETHEYHDLPTSQCIPCPTSQAPNEEQTGCVDLPVDYFGLGSTPAVPVLCLSAVGLGLAIAFSVLLYQDRHHLVVYSAGFVQSILLLACVAVGLASNSLFFVRPTANWCDLNVVVFYSNITLSFLLLNGRVMRLIHLSEEKVDIWRWLSKLATIMAKNTARQVSVIGTSQLLYFIALVAVEFSHGTDPVLEVNLVTRKTGLHCSRDPDTLIVGTIPWALLLLSLCVFSFKIRRLMVPQTVGLYGIPNEATLLGFATFIMTLLWLTLAAISRSSSGVSVPVATSTAFMLHQFAILGCLFTPRVYALLKWEKTREGHVHTHIRSIRGSQNTSEIALSLRPRSLKRESSLKRQSSRLTLRSPSPTTPTAYVSNPSPSPDSQPADAWCVLSRPPRPPSKLLPNGHSGTSRQSVPVDIADGSHDREGRNITFADRVNLASRQKLSLTQIESSV